MYQGYPLKNKTKQLNRNCQNGRYFSLDGECKQFEERSSRYSKKVSDWANTANKSVLITLKNKLKKKQVTRQHREPNFSWPAAVGQLGKNLAPPLLLLLLLHTSIMSNVFICACKWGNGGCVWNDDSSTFGLDSLSLSLDSVRSQSSRHNE
jgi:hypothetical protein